MIKISRQQKDVTVNISLSIGWNIDLTYPRSCDMDAILLSNQIQADLKKKIETIRREAYELGWKQAKSKKVSKKDWFNGNINSDYV